jgi:predicted nucleic acid-binding protein
MVLADTSVWIRFLGNHQPYAKELDRLLGLDEVVGHAMVFGELLVGDLGGRSKTSRRLPADAPSGHSHPF